MFFTTINGAAQTLGIAASRIRKWSKQGRVPGFFSGSRFMVDVERLREKIERGDFAEGPERSPGTEDGDGEDGGNSGGVSILGRGDGG